MFLKLPAFYRLDTKVPVLKVGTTLPAFPKLTETFWQVLGTLYNVSITMASAEPIVLDELQSTCLILYIL